jgi:hypothetical protein
MNPHLLSIALLLGSLSVLAQQSPVTLESAYKAESTDDLVQFLESWQKSVPAAEDGDRTQTFAAALEIFKDFYKPRQLERLGRPEWGTALYSSATYAIVQATLRYQVIADHSFPGKVVTQSDVEGSVEVPFCPSMQLGEMKALCLTDAFAAQLQQFLGDQANPPFPSPTLPIRPAEESAKRLDFLNGQLKVFRGHWGGWYLETHPRVSLIRFNQSGNQAVVFFQVVHQGGEARYLKTEHGWVFQEARFTWIT